MKLNHYLSPEQILVNIDAKDKDEALSMLVNAMFRGPAFSDQSAVTPDHVLDLLRARARDYSCGVGHGVALPHARIPNYQGLGIALATLAEPLNFNAPDGEPVSIICMTLAPEEEPTLALMLYSKLSQLLSDCAVRAYFQTVTDLDATVGKIVAALREANAEQDTLIFFTSDNGPEPNIYPEVSIRSQGYTYDYDNLGEIGSFSYLGPNFASAAAAPLSYFKFYTGEGGLRVPLIISGPGIKTRTEFENAVTHVTDITPTILALAGVDPVRERFGGRKIEPITGKDLTPLLEGNADIIYQPNDYVAFEVAGNAALFTGQYKIVLNRKTFGDGEWHLFDIVNDPGETKDLKAHLPKQFQHMLNLNQRYAEKNRVQPVPDYYIQEVEVTRKILAIMFADNMLIWLLIVLTLGLFALYARRRKREKE